MLDKRRIKLAGAGFIFFSALTQIVFAANNAASILDASINWADESSKLKLLATVPQWDNQAMTALFDVYRHAERYQLPPVKDDKQYNIRFLNAFWGPLSNPFVKYPRPVKAFIFFDKSAQQQEISGPSVSTYMVPLIHNTTDNNYYIFDKSQAKPMLLNDWVNNLREAQHYPGAVRFNICDGYGDLPTDVCQQKNYQEETKDMDRDSGINLLHKPKIPSAYRPIQEDWTSRIDQSRLAQRLGMGGGSIYEQSIDWNNLDARNKLLNTVVSWPNFQTIKANFEKIRDIRYFQDEDYPGFARRVTWLYPDDGCWTRASAVIKDLFGPFNNIANNFTRPSKVFAFGNLCANTSNSPSGRVTWWYHTAPIVRDAETNLTYVLDPAVSPRVPLTMENWIAAITSRSDACAKSRSSIDTFNICNGYGTGPYNSCNDPTKVDYTTEVDAMLDQSFYRYEERSRQQELGRDANAVLGNQPPWINANN